jgi:hypothetical protein
VFPGQQLAIAINHHPGLDPGLDPGLGRVWFEASCAASVVASGQLLVE